MISFIDEVEFQLNDDKWCHGTLALIDNASLDNPETVLVFGIEDGKDDVVLDGNPRDYLVRRAFKKSGDVMYGFDLSGIKLTDEGLMVPRYKLEEAMMR